MDILGSAKTVAESARHLTISNKAARSLAEQLADREIPKWQMDVHYSDEASEGFTANYLLLLDALNFCFWPSEWEVEYKEHKYGGYMALAASLKRAIEEDVKLCDANYQKNMTLNDLKNVFRGEGELALIQRRLDIIHQNAEVLMDRLDGSFAGFIADAKGSALELTKMIAATFPSFNDTHRYKGKDIPIMKRAQILVADIYGAFKGRGLGAFHDIDRLTIFADYKIPQILRHFKVLDYFKPLADKVDNRVQIGSGSEDEIEIRCATIWACEIIRLELERLGRDIKPFELDWMLWNMSQDIKMKPYHRTLTHFY
ncbi:hypothetical protein COV93_05615 [Candidatus Woesearchaeota archaeon CG11_big_fil_rev_8_21_14_0_20_43_8]|nr:MAG: hypothetical protein COV93_05615 [Candidatus Woesearchaeota archaeon CG11_big_fil_rev_8_21_14_0_20_43_8]PIO04885.1 MAG: hypothetical protein COT47_07090 [Candidatus Woesearchaeota archaeon CG08_land_8_20_14_0_20_43_7]